MQQKTDRGEIASCERFELHSEPLSIDVHTFAEDVREGLGRVPKSLSPKYFYDALGSALFEAICHLPEYYLTRAEESIFSAHADQIIRYLPGPLDIVELGSGSATKTRYLIEAALRTQEALHYVPIDISKDALVASARRFLNKYEKIRITAYHGDYFSVLESRRLPRSRRVLVLFLGSNIGNSTPEDARRLLRAVADSLRPGDGLLLGADLKKDAQTLEAAYNDSLGVTAAFNRNLLARINNELGGTFNLRNFRFLSQYDEERGCVDSYLQAVQSQRVHIEQLDADVDFAAGESIHTESSYKYGRTDIEALARDTGFRLAHMWLDKRAQFSVNLLVRLAPAEE